MFRKMFKKMIKLSRKDKIEVLYAYMEEMQSQYYSNCEVGTEEMGMQIALCDIMNKMSDIGLIEYNCGNWKAK